MSLFNNMYGVNPFTQQETQGGLLGMAGMGQPGLGLFGASQQPAQNQYDQMAAPYAKWAAQQLRQVAPETQVPQMPDWDSMQRQALGQMWDQYQRNQWNGNGY